MVFSQGVLIGFVEGSPFSVDEDILASRRVEDMGRFESE